MAQLLLKLCGDAVLLIPAAFLYLNSAERIVLPLTGLPSSVRKIFLSLGFFLAYRGRIAVRYSFRYLTPFSPMGTTRCRITDDPDDNKFLGCALEAKAYYVVSGDNHLLSLKHFHGIQIVDAKAFVQEIERKTSRQ